MEVAYRAQRCMHARDRERVPSMVSVLERSVGDFPSRPLFRALLVDAYVTSGRLDDARRELGPAVAAHLNGLSPGQRLAFRLVLPRRIHAGAPGHRHRNGAAQRLRPYQDVTAANLVEIVCGPVLRSLGLLSACTGDRQQAVAQLEAAIDACDRMRSKPCAKQTRADLERVLGQVRIAPGRPAGADAAPASGSPTRRLSLHVGPREIPAVGSKADPRLEGLRFADDSSVTGDRCERWRENVDRAFVDKNFGKAPEACVQLTGDELTPPPASDPELGEGRDVGGAARCIAAPASVVLSACDGLSHGRRRSRA